MEPKTSMSKWIYSTAELYGVSVEQIRFILNKCKAIYGNKLSIDYQKNYVRAVLNEISSIHYFQFTGKLFTDCVPKYSRNLPWMDYVPKWFRFFYETSRACYLNEPEGWVLGKDENGNLIYDDQESIVFKDLNMPIFKGDYIVNIGNYGIVPVPKDIFESGYQKNEVRLHNWLIYVLDMAQ